MTQFQTIFILVVFAAVILAIAFDVVDMVLAALLGVAALIVVGVFSAPDVAKITGNSAGPIALLFGGMIVAGVLAPTGLFDWVGTRYLRFTRGSGKRFLIGLVILVGALCAVLPNATTVVLLAPVIIRVARALDIDIVPPMILTAIVSNTAGLLTLVGDPATFLVGSSIGMSFGEYLQKVSLGGLLTLLALAAMLPWLMRDIWNLQRELPAELPKASITRPFFATVALLVLVVMVALFLFGEDVPWAIAPPAVAIVAAALALLVVQAAKVEPVGDLVKRVDWKTILFLVLLFALVEAFNKTGVLQSFSNQLYAAFGTQDAGRGSGDAGRRRSGIDAACQHSRRRGDALRGEELSDHRRARARTGARSHLRQLARRRAADLRRDDVRRHARRQRNADRRVGQRGERRHLRARRTPGVLRRLHALRRAGGRRAARRLGALRDRARLPDHALTVTSRRLRPAPR